MKLSRVRNVLLLLTVVLWNVYLLSNIEQEVQKINCFPQELAWQNFKAQTITEETLEKFYAASDGDLHQLCEMLTMYYAMDNTCENADLLQKNIDNAKNYQPERFRTVSDAVYSAWNGISHFPVGAVDNIPEATVSFSNSWAFERLYGGERTHEGCDIMASENKRGIYPVYSVSDGVVENVGWLKLGGYRIGIRSASGAYFYYAHLAEYAREFKVGETITAGTLLGFMGDTGYSEVPGTTGNFDVHLHFGIYLKNEDGTEFAVNPYPQLLYLWKHGKNEFENR